MTCPNCKQELVTQTLDNQVILYCQRCGGSFFEENGINRISLKSAKQLLTARKEDIILGSEKLCPIDQAKLTAILEEESVPQNVGLFRCPTCRGVFAYPFELVRFKQAQEAKVNYLNLWNIPPQTIRSVLVLTFVVVFSLTVFSTYLLLQKQTSMIQAQDIIKTVNVSRSGRYLFISFRSLIPLRTKIIFQDRTKNSIEERNISVDLKTLHFYSTTNINLEDEIYYQIVGINSKGKVIETKIERLVIGKP